MLKIRMQRVGRTNDPHFRFVLTDSRNSTKSGRFLEVLGHSDARAGGVRSIKADRVKHWLSKGAIPTDSVHNFLVRSGIITGAKRHVGKTKKEDLKTVSKASVITEAVAAPAESESEVLSTPESGVPDAPNEIVPAA